MRLLHWHRWVEVGRHYTPPDPHPLEGRGTEAYALARAMVLGFTTVSLRCRECGHVKTLILDGNAST